MSLAGVQISLAHHKNAILARRVGEYRDWLQDDVGAFSLRLLRRAAVEAPRGQFGELREAGEFLDLRLAAKASQRLVAIEPDVFQFIFGHREM
jgi:hypothetical protein